MLSSEAYYCINQSLEGVVSQIIKACVAIRSNLKQLCIVGKQFNKKILEATKRIQSRGLEA